MNTLTCFLLIFFLATNVLIYAQESSDCKLSPVSGLCHAFFEMFYFDSTTKQCKKFVYGGCGGNQNRFKTFEQCMKVCGQT
ncbi:hypothetical protein I4U23_022151 [Adineta vaga]|nr:hypothetical protein I4U23_022151 [Adineta vaga]